MRDATKSTEHRCRRAMHDVSAAAQNQFDVPRVNSSHVRRKQSLIERTKLMIPLHRSTTVSREGYLVVERLGRQVTMDPGIETLGKFRDVTDQFGADRRWRPEPQTDTDATSLGAVPSLEEKLIGGGRRLCRMLQPPWARRIVDIADRRCDHDAQPDVPRRPRHTIRMEISRVGNRRRAGLDHLRERRERT